MCDFCWADVEEIFVCPRCGKHSCDICHELGVIHDNEECKDKFWKEHVVNNNVLLSDTVNSAAAKDKVINDLIKLHMEHASQFIESSDEDSDDESSEEDGYDDHSSSDEATIEIQDCAHENNYLVDENSKLGEKNDELRASYFSYCRIS